jgi:hypothetical protein
MATLSFPGPAPIACDTPRCTRVAGFYCEWNNPQPEFGERWEGSVYVCAEHLTLTISDATDSEHEIHVDVMRLTL